MQFFISSQKDAKSLAKKIKPTHIISISSPEKEAPFDSGFGNAKILRLSFYDITTQSAADSLDEKDVPTRSIAETIYNFGKEFDDDTILLIHCFAGISRSSAAGIISLTPRYGAIGATKKVGELTINGQSGYEWFFPNPVLIEAFDDMLHFDGELFDLVGDNFFKQKRSDDAGLF
jgi:predicted protein tyrosine phosphatase